MTLMVARCPKGRSSCRPGAEAHEPDITRLIFDLRNELFHCEATVADHCQHLENTLVRAPMNLRGPQSAQMPAVMDAKRFVCALPTILTVDVEQFCS